MGRTRRPAKMSSVENATRAFCGCIGGQMELISQNHRTTRAKNACVLGKAWFPDNNL